MELEEELKQINRKLVNMDKDLKSQLDMIHSLIVAIATGEVKLR